MTRDLQTTQPVISVVIPLYNKVEYVEAAVQSALAQGGSVAEVIVVDDGSTDDGAGIVRTLAATEPRIRLIAQANGGASAARNSGVAAARGDYVAFLDADDCYLEGFLDEIVRMIGLFPNAGLYATGYSRVSDRAGRLTPYQPVDAAGRLPRLIHDFFGEWSRGPMFCTGSACVPTRLFREAGIAFPIGECLGEDQDVWFRIAERYPIAYSPLKLVLYRTDTPQSLTSSTTQDTLLPSYLRLGERIDLGELPRQHLSSARRLLASHYLNVARVRLNMGDPGQAMRIMLQPRAWQNPAYWLRTLGYWVVSLPHCSARRRSSASTKDGRGGG